MMYAIKRKIGISGRRGNMSGLEKRLIENGYVFEKEQEVTFGLRSGMVKKYVKSGGYCVVFISREEIVFSNGVKKKELDILKGYK